MLPRQSITPQTADKSLEKPVTRPLTGAVGVFVPADAICHYAAGLMVDVPRVWRRLDNL